MSRFFPPSVIAPELKVRPSPVGPVIETAVYPEYVSMAPHLRQSREKNDHERGYTIDYRGDQFPLA